ncbi:MAG: hypothetical protein RQ899_08140 [Pseudomonadales bacterium]|nr:hypothetical protein [Pseudomonadales bacterium]
MFPVNLLTASLAFVVYGSWAAYVNSEYGLEALLRAGLGQGLYAFFSTWLVTAAARTFLQKIGYNRKGLFISFLLTFCVMLAIPVTLHTLLRTRDVWEAILPGLIWGSVYILLVLRLSYQTDRDD